MLCVCVCMHVSMCTYVGMLCVCLCLCVHASGKSLDYSLIYGYMVSLVITTQLDEGERLISYYCL